MLIRKFWFAQLFGLSCLGIVAPNLFFSPDSGGGEGGGTGEGEGGGEEKKFTQADLDRMIKERLRKAERESKADKDALKTLQAQVAELQDQLKKKDPADPLPADVQGQIDLLRRENERKTLDLQNKLEAMEKERNSERQKREEGERDRELSDALSECGCTDMKMGKRMFMPQIVRDGDSWMFELSNDKGLVSIAQGVKEELPNYLRPASMQGGGSGSTGGSPKTAAKRKELEDERKKLKEMEIQATKAGGRQDFIMAFQRQKRKVADLERSLT